jgi:hypothetical protein
MNSYILTFEAYSKRKKKSKKKKIWDELLKVKKRPFKSVKVQPEDPVNHPDLKIPSPHEGG